ncbi:MAG: phosphate signaling complex protein PhoU [Actinomycetota bacterium]
MTDPNVPVPDPAPPAEVRVAYHRELEDLNTRILQLGAMVCETIPRGTEVLLGGDLQRARELIESDDEIDQLALQIEEDSFSILARQSPMASDLRQVVTVTKLVAELERSADLMINVCKAARRMYGSPMSPRIRGVITNMSNQANKLLRLSLDAFADADVALATALDDVDDTLDQLNRDMVAAIFEAHAEEEIDLAAAVQLALVARYYERIGDHAVNIGERVTYMVTGWLPENTGALRAQNRAEAIIESGDVVTPPPDGDD